MHELRTDGDALVLGELEWGGLLVCPGAGRGGRSAGLNGRNHVHHVDVGDVVQLAGTALAHTDNCQVQGVHGLAAARSRQARAQPLRHLGARDGERTLQRGGGQIGEVAADGRHHLYRVFAAHVNHGDAR